MENEVLDATEVTLTWTEGHYSLFSHLMSEDCPLELAANVELAIFPCSPLPDMDKLNACIAAVVESDGPEEANEALAILCPAVEAELS